MNTSRRADLIAKMGREMSRAYRASDAGKPREALEIYRAVEERWRAAGIESGYLLWNMAVACDTLGELEDAFEYIDRAVNADPLAQPIMSSFEIIVGRVRAALADDARAVDDPSTPRLYELLSGAGEADVASHVAMARWCAATGELGRAGKLADALITLHPEDPLSWRCKAEVARAAGDVATADECSAEAAARGIAPAPFAVPGVAQG